MRRFITLSLILSTLLLVSVCSAQQTSNPAVLNLMGYSGTLNLGLLTDPAQETSPAPRAKFGPGTPAQERIRGTPARVPIVEKSGTIHPVVWITDINGDTSRSPRTIASSAAKGVSRS